MRIALILMVLCALPAGAAVNLVGNGDFALPAIGDTAIGWSGDWGPSAWQRIDGAAVCNVSRGVGVGITSDTLIPAGRYIVRFRSKRLTPMDDAVIVLHLNPSRSILCRFEDRWQEWNVIVDSPTPWRLEISAYCGWVTPPAVVPLVRIAIDDISVECVEPVYGAGMALGGVGW